MRTRLVCDTCNYKTISETVLRQHKQLNHDKKHNLKKSKRKVCEGCSKKFNKAETLTTHMKKCQDLKTRKIKLSVKAAQIDEEKSLIAKFGEGATKSGATLKGIFEKAIGSKKKKKEEK